MATDNPLIRSSLLSELPALILERGGSLEDILEEAELSLEQLEQPTLLIPLSKQVRLLQLAAKRSHCEEFALELARRQDVAIFGALSLLAGNCNTVQQGLQLFGQYLHYSVQGVDLELREQNDLGYFTIDTPFALAAGSNQFWDHSVALAFSVTKMLCGENWAPRSTFLRRPEPPDPGAYSRYFRSPVAFDSDFSGLVFPAENLHQPISVSINAVPRQLQEYLRKSFEGNFLEQIRRVIISLLPTRDCTANTVADCVGLSRRTLQRKLQREQTSFQQQIDGVRSELAVSYLQEPQFSLTDIAELLGFAELSVFSHTFKRWFGVTPSQWRSRRFG